MDARFIFMRSGADLLSVPLDAFGMTIEKRLAECNYLYCTPSHQAPTGVTMSTERRLKLLSHAVLHDQVIIEDDYEPELKYEGAAAAALKAMDRSGRVIYLSSLSKLVCPGLRIGYIVGPEKLMTELKSLRKLMMRQLPGNNLASAAQFIRQGHYDRLIGAVRRSLAIKATIIIDVLRKELPVAQLEAPTGGSAIWMRIPGTSQCGQAAGGLLRGRRAARSGRAVFRPAAEGQLGAAQLRLDPDRTGGARHADLCPNRQNHAPQRSAGPIGVGGIKIGRSAGRSRMVVSSRGEDDPLPLCGEGGPAKPGRVGVPRVAVPVAAPTRPAWRPATLPARGRDKSCGTFGIPICDGRRRQGGQPPSAAGEMLRLTMLRMAKLDCSRATPASATDAACGSVRSPACRAPARGPDSRHCPTSDSTTPRRDIWRSRSNADSASSLCRSSVMWTCTVIMKPSSAASISAA